MVVSRGEWSLGERKEGAIDNELHVGEVDRRWCVRGERSDEVVVDTLVESGDYSPQHLVPVVESMWIEASHLSVGWLSTQPMECNDEEVVRGECRRVGVLVVLLCGEGEQLIPAALIDQFDVGCSHTRVAVQRLLVYRPGCPRFLQDLW